MKLIMIMLPSVGILFIFLNKVLYFLIGSELIVNKYKKILKVVRGCKDSSGADMVEFLIDVDKDDEFSIVVLT